MVTFGQQEISEEHVAIADVLALGMLAKYFDIPGAQDAADEAKRELKVMKDDGPVVLINNYSDSESLPRLLSVLLQEKVPCNVSLLANDLRNDDGVYEAILVFDGLNALKGSQQETPEVLAAKNILSTIHDIHTNKVVSRHISPNIATLATATMKLKNYLLNGAAVPHSVPDLLDTIRRSLVRIHGDPEEHYKMVRDVLKEVLPSKDPEGSPPIALDVQERVAPYEQRLKNLLRTVERALAVPRPIKPPETEQYQLQYFVTPPFLPSGGGRN